MMLFFCHGYLHKLQITTQPQRPHSPTHKSIHIIRFMEVSIQALKDFFTCAEYGLLPRVRRFMEQYNVMATIPNVGIAGVFYALRGDRVETVKYFVEEEMMINNAQWMERIRAYAFHFEKHYCAAYLLTLGLPMPADADAPLVAVVRRGQFGVIGKMLRQGYCNVNMPGRFGETALDVAIRRRQWCVTSMLMHVGCKVATWPSIGEHVPYPKATQCPLIVRQLLGRVIVKRFLMMVYATVKAHALIPTDKQARMTDDDDKRIKMRQATQIWQRVIGQLVGVEGSTYIPADMFVCVMKYV